MLYLIKNIDDPYFNLLSEDPIRPNIPHKTRLGENKDIFVMTDLNGSAASITCVSYQNFIPQYETELFSNDLPSSTPNVAVFYTIWSYHPGSGRKLIFDSVEYIRNNKPNITKFITLSPKTEMARKFHLKNGALVYRENKETTNYEYVIN
jgi:hypothetical protein